MINCAAAHLCPLVGDSKVKILIKFSLIRRFLYIIVFLQLIAYVARNGRWSLWSTVFLSKRECLIEYWGDPSTARAQLSARECSLASHSRCNSRKTVERAFFAPKALTTKVKSWKKRHDYQIAWPCKWAQIEADDWVDRCVLDYSANGISPTALQLYHWMDVDGVWQVSTWTKTRCAW